jgi:hypothetical protein
VTAKCRDVTPSKSFALGLLLCALGACKPGVGSSCDKGDARCVDRGRALACQDGKFIETPCRGPGGCTLAGESVTCDVTHNRLGDACTTDDEGAASCAGADRMLLCRGGSYTFVPCRGPLGCADQGGRAFCDMSVAEAGDVCRESGIKACASDAKQVLVCKKGAMAPFFSCRGAAGCRSSAGKLACDTSIARTGDTCDAAMEGRAFSCTEDHGSILTCKGGGFVLDQKCKATESCEVDGSTTRCAKRAKS